jgi:hypothetical protein
MLQISTKMKLSSRTSLLFLIYVILVTSCLVAMAAAKRDRDRDNGRNNNRNRNRNNNKYRKGERDLSQMDAMADVTEACHLEVSCKNPNSGIPITLPIQV